MAHIKKFEEFRKDEKSTKLNETEETVVVPETEEVSEENIEETVEVEESTENVTEDIADEYEEMDCSEYEEDLVEEVAEEVIEEVESKLDELFKSKESDTVKAKAKVDIESKLDDYEGKDIVVNRELIMKKAEENKFRGHVEARKSEKSGKVLAIYIDGLTKFQKLTQNEA